MPGRYRGDHLAGLQRMLTGGESRVIGTTVELAAIRRNGSEFPVELSLSKWESEGQLFFTGMIRDISERRRFEEELRRSEERFRLMVDTVGDYAIFMLDPEGRVTTWNAGAERIKGYRPEEIVGKHFSC